MSTLASKMSWQRGGGVGTAGNKSAYIPLRSDMRSFRLRPRTKLPQWPTRRNVKLSSLGDVCLLLVAQVAHLSIRHFACSLEYGMQGTSMRLLILRVCLLGLTDQQIQDYFLCWTLRLGSGWVPVSGDKSNTNLQYKKRLIGHVSTLLPAEIDF